MTIYSILRFACALILAMVVWTNTLIAAAPRPNIIVIFTDDQGYQDLGSFGSKTIKTPHLDRMAAGGMMLTSFYAQPVCGVSRAALMTGSYPIRVGEPGNLKRLHTVPHPDELTMAEVLKSAGYATGIIGKWHLCDRDPKAPGGYEVATMPLAQGFDFFYGTPWYNGPSVRVTDVPFRSPIFRNREVVVPAVENWDTITADYTREAIAWIKQQRSNPFFLYLAHNMPHVPLGASKNFAGKSAGGPYGDTIEEIDWSSGEIFKIARYPKVIPAGTASDELATQMDFLPTFAALAGANAPADRVLDGRNIRSLLGGAADARTPHEAFSIIRKMPCAPCAPDRGSSS